MRYIEINIMRDMEHLDNTVEDDPKPYHSFVMVQQCVFPLVECIMIMKKMLSLVVMQ